MKFTINKATLQKELQFMQAIVEKGNTIPVLTQLLIEASGNGQIKMVGTDLDATLTTEAEARIDKNGSCLVSADKLFSIVKTLPATAEIKFELLQNGHVSVTCERATFKLLGTDTAEFPEVASFKEGSVQIPSSVLQTMIQRTIFSITQETSRYSLSGAKFEIDKKGARMVTTDGHRLSFIEHPELKSKESLEVLIPRKVLAGVLKLAAAHEAELRFGVDENHVYFQAGPRTLVARLLAGQFPNYEMVMPKDNDQVATLKSDAFSQSLRRVAVMADDRCRAVRMQFGNSELKISAETPDQGEAHEEPAADFKGEQIEIGFNSSYLLDVLNNVDCEEFNIEMKDANSQAQLIPVGDEQYTSKFIVMPMRV
ncbi:MAG: DNA polymerase III subunit beta [Pyrinomonadaceae bacterium]